MKGNVCAGSPASLKNKQFARKWATAMPNARLLELKGIGHFPYVEAPDAFLAAINRFLQGDWPEGTTR